MTLILIVTIYHISFLSFAIFQLGCKGKGKGKVVPVL